MDSFQQNSQEIDYMTQGVAFLDNDNPHEALKAFKQAIKVNPKDALAHYNAGVACQTLQDEEIAVAFYRQTIQLKPGFNQAHHNLAQAYADQARVQAAIETYHQALFLDPEDYKSAYNLSLLYRKIGNDQAALLACQRSLQANPNFAEAFSNLGLMYSEQNRFAESLVCLEQALKINPHLPEAHLNMGVVFQKSGQYERGLESYHKALASDPNYAPARWLSLLSLPMLYESPAQIEHYRRHFTLNMDKLIKSIDLTTDFQKQYALNGIKTSTNFYLQYQGGNDLGLQRKYGEFVHRIMASNYPQWVKKIPMPPLKANERIRIGYVSSFMCHHTIGTFLSGWIENQDRSVFDIHCYHVGKKFDGLTKHFQNISDTFHHFADNVEATARQIVEDRLHVLVYSDIGMHPTTMLLAALRLAPVQCKGWGHPVTTGLPTIDYYLSSDLMEPQHADQYYSETLVRLPNLALCYRKPEQPKLLKTKDELGIPKNRFVYLSTQSIFKYLPQHDHVYAQIASQVPHACFVFIRNQSTEATDRFRHRLKTAFSAYGLDADQFCHFSHRLNYDDFLNLNLAADVLLDTFDWSGGKTTLEALSCGLPVVSCPGRFMRGRHAFAMLKRIELRETVCMDQAGYIRIAVQLAHDPVFYARVKQKLSTGLQKLYGDQEFIQHLESFYKSIVHKDR